MVLALGLAEAFCFVVRLAKEYDWICLSFGKSFICEGGSGRGSLS